MEEGHDSCLINQQDGEYMFSPMMLETSCYAFHRSHHTDPTSSAFHLQGNTQKVPSSSPLGLTLRKTPSLLTMFESKLFKEGRHPTAEQGARKTDIPSSSTKKSQQSNEKLKASNFGASFLKIGKWQRVKRFEGDLVAKCYFAKKKLVWEVLEGALKSKIEIQWCDIMGIRAQLQEPNQPGVLEIELSQPPMFYHESDPKPRKHTCWQPCPDFTGGQALSVRRHYVTFPPDTLDRHYMKLLKYDKRLSELSQRTFPTLESPYFPSHYSDMSMFSFEPSGFMLHDYLHYPPKDAPPTTKQSTRVDDLSLWRSTFSGEDQLCHQYESMETEELPVFCSHGVEPAGPMYDIEKHFLSDTQDTLLVKVRSMCSLLDYSTQPTSNNGSSKYMEAEYENNACSNSNLQMENYWFDELNKFNYSEDANLGSCLYY